jgi:hypothetical protein
MDYIILLLPKSATVGSARTKRTYTWRLLCFSCKRSLPPFCIDTKVRELSNLFDDWQQ